MATTQWRHDELQSHFLARLAGANLETKPFEHVVVDEILPPAYCDELIANQPPDRAYSSQPHSNQHRARCREKVGADGERQQIWLRLAGNTTGEVGPAWTNLASWMTCSEILDAIAKAFKGVGLRGDKLLPRFRLVKETGASYLAPHVDMEKKAATFLVYLSPNEDGHLPGTTMYSDEGRRDEKTIAFKSNRAVFLARTPCAWHGVEPAALHRPRLLLHCYLHLA